MTQRHETSAPLERGDLDALARLERYVPTASPNEDYVVSDKWNGAFPPPWPVWDQGRELSCAAFAVAGAVMCHQLRAEFGGVPFPVVNRSARAPSARFIFFAAKHARNELGKRSGVLVSDAMSVVRKHGACTVERWESLGPEYRQATRWRPDMWDRVEREVLPHTQPERYAWRRLTEADGSRDVGALRACLCEDRPFTICVNQFRDYREPGAPFEGEYSLPEPGSGYRMSGKWPASHAMLVIGYHTGRRNSDGSDGAFVVRNSEGPKTGATGYFWLPFEWAANPDYSYGLCTLWNLPGRS